MKPLRKIIKGSLISLLVLAAFSGIFHLWLIAHAKSILTEFVSSQSNGKYRLQVKSLKYDYLKLRLEVQQPVLTSQDTSITNDQFEMHARRISLQLEKLWPLISGRHLLIDSITMDEPYFSIIHQKHINPQIQKNAFRLSEEMEKVYKSIQSVLASLKVANFRINKGSFALNNSLQKNLAPLEIKNIDFFIKGLKIDSSGYSPHADSYAKDIQLRIGGQTIQFPDGSKMIRFSSFRFDANNGNLEVDSCGIASGDDDSTRATFNLFAEKMRIRNIYLASDHSADYNKIDSLFFTRPKVSFSFQIKDAKQDSSVTISTALNRITSAAFGKILMKYVSINNVDFDIDVERKEKISTFNFVQDTLEVFNLGLGLSPTMPVSADNIRFGVKEFVDYFRDSTYLVHFDSVRINNDQFSLFNFKMESTTKVKKGEQKIVIPVLQLEGIDWFQLLTQKRLMASNFTLTDPSIAIIAAGEGKSRSMKKNNNLDRQLRQMFIIKNIAINNGKINYTFPGNGYLQVKNINTALTPGDISEAVSLSSVQKMIRQLKTGDLVYVKDGWKMLATNMFFGQGSSLGAATINLTNERQNFRMKANNITLSKLEGGAKSRTWNLGKLTWDHANISMDLSKQKNNVTSNLAVSLDGVNAGSTELQLINSNTHINAKITSLKSGGIFLDKKQLVTIHTLMADGTSVDVNGDNTRLHIGKFQVKDQLPSYLNSITANFSFNNQSYDISIPVINFEPDLLQALRKQYNARWINIIKPVIHANIISHVTTTSAGPEKLFPEIETGKIEITEPVVSFLRETGKAPMQVQSGRSFFSAGGIKTLKEGRQLTLKNIQFQSENFNVNTKDSFQYLFADSKIALRLSDFSIFSTSSAKAGKWEVADGSADLTDMNLMSKRKSGPVDTFQIATLHLDKLSFNEKSFKKPLSFFSSDPLATISNVNLVYHNEKSRFRVKGLSAGASSLSLDSFTYNPKVNKDVFMTSQPFQKDYITVASGPVFLKAINATAWFKDSVLKMGHVYISNASVTSTRDKSLPLQPDIIKELPVNLVKKIPFKIAIDSVSIVNSKAVYNEVSEKTHQTGTILFNRMSAVILNIKNHDFFAADSLQIHASAFVMDTAFLQLKLKESYNDSLASFPVIVNTKPFDLKVLNSFLLPLMNVKIKSGFVDLLQMRAIGREYLSLGELKFFYHDLKVEFLKDGNQQKKTLLTSLKTFAANSFIIKNNNSSRLGKVYYERSRNRSFFNYLVKMLASGGASSVGAKRNKKFDRIYINRIRELNLPEIDF